MKSPQPYGASHDTAYLERPELNQLVAELGRPATRAVLITGPAYMGKTVLLRMVDPLLREAGFTPVAVPARRMRGIEGLGAAVLEAIRSKDDSHADEDLASIVRTTSRKSHLESLEDLERAASLISRPILLLDGVDEWDAVAAVAPVIAELVERLDQWKFVITARTPESFGSVEGLPGVVRMVIDRITADRTRAWLHHLDPDMPDDVRAQIAQRSQGIPLLITLAADHWRLTGRSMPDMDGGIELIVQARLEELPVSTRMVVNRLAILGEDRLDSLQQSSGLSSGQWAIAWDKSIMSNWVKETGTGSAVITHAFLREAALSALVAHTAFRLRDLDFGSEEGEIDSRLPKAYVQHGDVARILKRKATIVVGARGAGKSALVRRLLNGEEAWEAGSRAVALADVGRRLHTLVPNDAWSDRERLRAAWLLLIAAEVASKLPPSASKRLAREGRAILKVLGYSPAPSGIRRLAGVFGRLMGGSSLSFAVGPAIIEAKLPDGVSSVSLRSIDVYDFLQKSDEVLERAGSRIICLADQTDEIAKYDRAREEAAIQALLQAERDLRSLKMISLVAFVRTDLFDIFDIQEKNKLVSRTMRLDWHGDEWISLLVQRLVSNSGLERLTQVVATENPFDARAILRVLLPHQVEQRPVDLWLIDCLSDGNGLVSPRMAVLLLHLALENSPRQDEIVTRLPLFSESALAEAMTQLSALAFDEVVNDFKVASAFVRNSRAARLNDFDAAQVASLFDESEGAVSRQISDLERLGYLARRVINQGGQTCVRFQIPPLYRRAWGT